MSDKRGLADSLKRLEELSNVELMDELLMKNGVSQDAEYRDALFRQALVRIMQWQMGT